MKQTIQKLTVFTFLLSILVLSSCSEFDALCEKADGPVEDVTFNLDEITGIELTTSANVFFQKGNDQEVIVNGQRDAIERLNQTVDNGVWRIDFNDCINHDDMNIYITVPTIDYIKVTGSGDVFAEVGFESNENVTLRITGSGFIKLEMDAPEINSKITGSGDMILSGSTNTHHSKITGSGNIEAFNLNSIDNTIEITGSGDADIFIDGGLLDATIRGSGDIGYRGLPNSINVDITGSGQLVDRN